MKNDYRDYLQHSLFGGEHKYIKKVKTKSGEWRYIYPEDVKRDLSYKVRNLISKISGNNRTFEKKVVNEDPEKPGKKYKANIAATRYERIQREARKGLAKSQERNKLMKKFNNMDIASAKKIARSKSKNHTYQKAITAPDNAGTWYVKEKKENVIPGTGNWRIVKDDNKKKKKKKSALDSLKELASKKSKKRG